MSDERRWPPADAIWVGKGGPVGGWRAFVLLLVAIASFGATLVLVVQHRSTLGLLAVAPLLLVLVVGVIWALPATRTTWAITDRALFERRLFSSPKRLDLESIAWANREAKEVSRHRVTFWVNGTPVEVDITQSNQSYAVRLELTSGRALRLDPMPDADHLAALISGHLNSAITLAALRKIDGTPPSAYFRTDIFFSTESSWAGDSYGPVFIGPTWFVRFHAPLGGIAQALLLSLVARAEPAEKVEAALLDFLQPNQVGSFVALRRQELKIEWEGDSLLLRHGERTDQVDLAPERRAHARGLLRAQAPYRG